MPKIPDEILDCCFFLYESEEDANSGVNPRGTGFLVQHGGGIGNTPSFYGITNKHVACSGGASVIRINTLDGRTRNFNFDPAEWGFLPSGVDVAAIELDVDLKRDKVAFVHVSLFASDPIDRNQLQEVFVGEDTFMIGMFFDHQARTKNLVSVRFGNISMLPDVNALVKQPTDHMGQCFVVDMHSRTGFSGSPVFAFRTFGSDLGSHVVNFSEYDLQINFDPRESKLRDYAVIKGGSLRIKNSLKLIGIQCSQFPENWPHKKAESAMPKAENFVFEPPKTDYVVGFSGMSVVVPAWEILKTLNSPAFRERRAQKAGPT
jgi:hypothetical protein